MNEKLSPPSIAAERKRPSALTTVCTGTRFRGRERAGDLYAALNWVRRQLWADKNRIAHVLEILVSNAMKFTSEGSVSVAARAAGSEVVFWVTDTGSGIASEEIPHLFDRFWQARGQTCPGTGLGLAIVNATVQAHGGRVWVESELGSGSTFFFSLPIGPV